MGKNTVLVVDDDVSVREVIRKFLERARHEVIEAETCAAAERLWRETRPDIAVFDYGLPDGNALDLLRRLRAFDDSIPVIVLTGYGSIDLAVEAMRLGAEQFLTKPAELATLSLLIERSLENRRNRQKQLAASCHKNRDNPDPFIGISDAIRELEHVARRVVLSNSPVLIQGETGTGKGVLAHWLHRNGPRAAEPFVDLNCGGLSHGLLETELFGHERGAFTGAVQTKTGLLEIAHKGTIFLDEIGDVDLQVQPKLLKVLEEKRFRRLGDVRDRRVDIRLIAASHQDMGALIRRRMFREDLYFRINTITLTTPPLRERKEDIPILVRGLLDGIQNDLGKGNLEFSAKAMQILRAYSWPGNIRELRNVLERAALLSTSQVLSEDDLHFDSPVEPDFGERGRIKTLDEVERQYIELVLSREGGRVERAAKKLGIPRSSLYYKIKQHGIGRANPIPRSGESALHG
jgi:DNA-binding NtrC family response regulator